MPDTPSITLVKTIPWRTQPEEWSNTYHFSPSAPPNPAAWKALADAWWDLERPFLGTDVKLVRAYGYEAGNEVNVWSYNYADPGPSPSGGYNAASETGELTLTVSFTTTERNSKGRPVHGMKYYHGVTAAGTSAALRDLVLPDQVGVCNTQIAKMFDGSLPGGIKYCMPQGAVITAGHCKTTIGEHQFKRRGKRPH